MNENLTHVSRLYDQVFVTFILQIFREDTVSGPAYIISVFDFSPVQLVFITFKFQTFPQNFVHSCV
jgi:hypothetical protein